MAKAKSTPAATLPVIEKRNRAEIVSLEAWADANSVPMRTARLWASKNKIPAVSRLVKVTMMVTRLQVKYMIRSNAKKPTKVKSK